MVTKEQIDKAAHAIADAVHPRKIYLFGSYAKGEATEQSDVDFLIVMPDRSMKKYHVANRIEKSIRNILPVSNDIVVDYADRFEMLQSIPYSFIGHIVNTGVLLYES